MNTREATKELLKLLPGRDATGRVTATDASTAEIADAADVLRKAIQREQMLLDLMNGKGPTT